MRLLNTHTGRLELFPSSPPDYAILSHVWAKKEGDDPEQTFTELVEVTQSHSPESGSVLHSLSKKIWGACTVAKGFRYDYIWIDTCCIDKSSSSELSEAINSMYSWYSKAKVCFAYLADVHDGDEGNDLAEFRLSEWFTRAWTLQELIAPPTVVFLSRSWSPIGSKASLAQTIKEITKIDIEILQGIMPLSDVTVARRMSWAAQRHATKIEDVAYSLLGIFSVHFVLNYGEGYHAFVRLQEEIMTRIPDQTLFAWGPRPIPFLCGDRMAPIPRIPRGTLESCLFARSPKDFLDWSDVRAIPPRKLEETVAHKIPHPELMVTAYGIRTSLPIISFPDIQLAILAVTDECQHILSLILGPPPYHDSCEGVAFGVPDIEWQRSEIKNLCSWPISTRLVALNRKFIKKHRPKCQVVYLRPSINILQHHSDDDMLFRLANAFKSDLQKPQIILEPWCTHLLRRAGYDVVPVDSGDTLTLQVNLCIPGAHPISVVVVVLPDHSRPLRADVFSLYDDPWIWPVLQRDGSHVDPLGGWEFADGRASKRYSVSYSTHTTSLRLSISLGTSTTQFPIPPVRVQLDVSNPPFEAEQPLHVDHDLKRRWGSRILRWMSPASTNSFRPPVPPRPYTKPPIKLLISPPSGEQVTSPAAPALEQDESRSERDTRRGSTLSRAFAGLKLMRRKPENVQEGESDNSERVHSEVQHDEARRSLNGAT